MSKMTVSEMIAWLESYPSDYIIQLSSEHTSEVVNFNPKVHASWNDPSDFDEPDKIYCGPGMVTISFKSEK